MLLWVRGMGKMPIPPTFYLFTLLLFYSFTLLLLSLFFKLQFELSSAQQIVAHAVVWRGAVQAYALAVRLRGIALVLLPVVVGIFLGKTVHIFVAKCLGEDAGCGYRLILTVALHYSSKPVRHTLWLPSTMTASGRTVSWSSARCMARKLALRMFMRSISSGVTTPTAHATASRTIWSRSVRRAFSVSFFESLSRALS